MSIVASDFVEKFVLVAVGIAKSFYATQEMAYRYWRLCRPCQAMHYKWFSYFSFKPDDDFGGGEDDSDGADDEDDKEEEHVS